MKTIFLTIGFALAVSNQASVASTAHGGIIEYDSRIFGTGARYGIYGYTFDIHSPINIRSG